MMRPWLAGIGLGVGLAYGLTACKPSSLIDVKPPETVIDPSQVGTVTGAIQLRNSALLGMTYPLGSIGSGMLALSGLLTDELAEGGSPITGVDERRVNDPSYGAQANGGLYIALHRARIRAQVARQALQLYANDAPGAPRAWQGEMYALEGYTVLWFAENFCSGIPLTSVPLVGEQQMTRGFTTQELFTRAIALFDSAMVVGADSAQYVNLARVGKGRALLGLGEFAAADSAVRDVPTDFVYLVRFTASGDYYNAFGYFLGYQYRVQDHEGTNGLIWSTDPRTAITTAAPFGEMLVPAKYNITPSGDLDPTMPQLGAPVRLADGLEARLIQAEAALAAGDASWLTTLNMLRATCVGSAACAPVPGITTANLPDTLTDPGSTAARQDLLFAERAKWLYLTAHREGDLRRLAHVYRRDRQTLWPTGQISSPAFPPLYGTPTPENGKQYGTDVVFASNPSERASNPLYGGCYDYNP